MLRWTACGFGLAVLVGLSALSAADKNTLSSPSQPTSPPFRLDRRLPLETSKVVGAPDPPPPYRTRRVFEKVKFDRPVYLTSQPLYDRVFVAEQGGRIVHLETKAGVAKAEELIKFPDHDTYGMTFHPAHAKNGRVYAFNNGPNSKPKKKNKVVEFRVEGNPPRLVKGSERLVIEWESNGHNGGDLAFGADGYLYITAGDGTSDSDGDVTGQNLRDLCSGVLRIDVDHPTKDKPYTVPADNPFLHVKDARPELYAFGLRNPWRMSFDAPTKNMWIGDVGQDWYEMIYLLQKGANYGWSVYEGSQPFHPQRKLGPGPVVKPVMEHPHAESRSITGGIVYRGKKFRDLVGTYIYGDYATGKIWGFRYEGGKVTWRGELASTRLQMVGFGADRDGELYVVDYTGQIHQFEPSPPAANKGKFPRKLSESGLFTAVAGHQTHPALIPYSVNAPLWSDGSHKERFLALPGMGTIGFTRDGAWKLPEGTVLVKTFALETEAGQPTSRQRIETRFLTLQEGEWVGYSYAWNEAQTDAELVEAVGRDRTFTIKDSQAPGGQRQQVWHYPSRIECMVCHTRAAGFVLGLHTEQMNKEHDYHGVRLNQLQALEQLGVFRVPTNEHLTSLDSTLLPLGRGLRASLEKALPEPVRSRVWKPLEKEATKRLESARQRLHAAVNKKPGEGALLPFLPDSYPRLADPSDRKAPLEARARAYFQGNCAHCHVWAGGGNAAIDLSYATALDKMKLVGERPLHDKFNLSDPYLIAPGAPERSVLLHRMSITGRGKMPPLGRAVVDQEGVELLRDWIRGMK